MNVVGTSLGPFYRAPEVQSVKNRAIRTLLNYESSDGAYDDVEQAAQDVLNLLYTAMMFGAFKDYTPQPSSVIDFPAVRDES